MIECSTSVDNIDGFVKPFGNVTKRTISYAMAMDNIIHVIAQDYERIQKEDADVETILKKYVKENLEYPIIVDCNGEWLLVDSEE